MESSRIFVRGLPPSFTEVDVRKHFARFPVTDVKYFPARRIGYVGYKTPQDATQAVKYFNKSFIRMTKIQAEIARPIGDEAIPKSHRQLQRERRAPKLVDEAPASTDASVKRKREEKEYDPKLQEYLNVMQAPSKTKAWANEDIQAVSDVAAPVAPEAVTTAQEESDDDYQTLAKKPRSEKTVPDVDTHYKKTAEPSKPTDNAMPVPAESKTTESEQESQLQDQIPSTDADWLRSRTNRVLDLVDDDEVAEDTEGPASAPAPALSTEAKKSTTQAEEIASAAVEDRDAADSASSEEDKIRHTGRLFLRNLHYDVRAEDIRTQFDKYGAVDEIHIPAKMADGKGKGFAFLQFEDPEHAVRAYQENDGTIFQGRLLHIISGRAKKDHAQDDFTISKMPLKKQKEVLRRKTAASNTFNWNSLYLNANAVLSTVAERLNINKADLLDPTASDAAVKQAQAETHIIQETKNYFAQQGVDLESFKRSAKGDTAILAKNIPHSLQSTEVRKLFEEHGTVTRLLMPPSGMTAIVEYANATQAKAAFASLSYRKLKDSILYLERAPKDLFKAGVVAMPVLAVSDANIVKPSAKDLLENRAALDTAHVSTLYVRNLNFSTTSAKLHEAFAPLGGFRSALVKTKVDPKRGLLSLGYGFVEFSSAEAANTALQAMDGYSLEGHALKIQASARGADAADDRRRADAAANATGTKILIKNLPFEATKKDVRALFAPYGSLRSVRVPKKFDSSSRGFAFVDYSTQRDATNAVDALKNTHLLGRRLVLAFAETESDDPELELEKMQQKTGSQANKVALQRLTSGGRRKFNVAGNDDLDET